MKVLCVQGTDVGSVGMELGLVNVHERQLRSQFVADAALKAWLCQRSLRSLRMSTAMASGLLAGRQLRHDLTWRRSASINKAQLLHSTTTQKKSVGACHVTSSQSLIREAAPNSRPFKILNSHPELPTTWLDSRVGTVKPICNVEATTGERERFDPHSPKTELPASKQTEPKSPNPTSVPDNLDQGSSEPGRHKQSPEIIQRHKDEQKDKVMLLRCGLLVCPSTCLKV